jgi:hypothetical protein
MYNPLSMSVRHFKTEIAVISKVDGKNYPIEKGLTAFSAGTPTTIDSVSIVASTFIV